MEQNNLFQIDIDGNAIKVSGILDGTGADRIIAAMNEDTFFYLDFDGVSDIRFTALRSLLNCRKSGKKFSVINAEPDVAEKFEDSGVSSFINVCRKPKPLDMSKFKEFGASFMSTAYNSEDGDSMIKVYGSRVPRWMAAQEKAIAKAVLIFGIPTPMAGEMYEYGENTALAFERIEGKRSFSRIMAEEPERLEEMSRRFARMCKKLHSTECDTSIFMDRTIYYRRAVANCKELNDDEKKRLTDFINSVPAATTCLHGDMQPSNVITNGVEDLWIDLSDFGYGNPIFDMGMWFFLSLLNTEERSQGLFHLGLADMRRVWDYFIDEYYGADTAEKRAEVTASIEPFAALHMLYLGSTYGFEPGMLDFIKAKLLS